MSISRTPLTLYFFEDNYLHEEDCGAFLGDRICNNVFNTIAYLYDEGDFCGPTCTGPTCGLGNMKIAFNTTAINNDGYSTCSDESMLPITIFLDDIFEEEEDETAFVTTVQSVVNFAEPRNPYMILECNDKVLLLVEVDLQ